MFLAYNKPVTDKMVSAKAVLLADTLNFLPMDKITPFFKYIRSTEDMFPSDAKLSKLLTGYMQSFPTRSLPRKSDGGEYPTPEQHGKAIKTIIAVMEGKVSKEEGHEFLTGIFAGEV